VSIEVGTARSVLGNDPTDIDPMALDVIAIDGTLVHLRTILGKDESALLGLMARASDASHRFRFFTGERASAARYVAGLISAPGSRRRSAGHRGRAGRPRGRPREPRCHPPQGR